MPIRLVGTEPFWSGRIAPEAITLSGVDRPERRFTAPKARPTSDGAVFTAAGVQVVLTAGACSDGMSDRTYPYAARVDVGAEQLNGCATSERDFNTDQP